MDSYFLSALARFYYCSGFPYCWGIGCLIAIIHGNLIFSNSKVFYFLVIYGFTIMCLRVNFFFIFPIWHCLGLLNVCICVSQFWKILEHCHIENHLSVFCLFSSFRCFRLLSISLQFWLCWLSISSNCPLFPRVFCIFVIFFWVHDFGTLLG